MKADIKKIMFEAAEYAKKVTAGNPSSFEGVFMGKYTELVVLECARISNEADDTVTGQGTSSAEAFKKHFGFE